MSKRMRLLFGAITVIVCAVAVIALSQPVAKADPPIILQLKCGVNGHCPDCTYCPPPPAGCELALCNPDWCTYKCIVLP